MPPLLCDFYNLDRVVLVRGASSRQGDHLPGLGNDLVSYARGALAGGHHTEGVSAVLVPTQ